MFNGSYLRACIKLWFVKKLDFPFMSLGGPSHGAGFDVSGLRIEGYMTCWKDELGNHTLGTTAQNMHQLRVFWG